MIIFIFLEKKKKQPTSICDGASFRMPTSGLHLFDKTFLDNKPNGEEKKNEQQIRTEQKH